MDVVVEGGGIGPVAAHGLDWFIGVQGPDAAHEGRCAPFATLPLCAMALGAQAVIELLTLGHGAASRGQPRSIRSDVNVPARDLLVGRRLPEAKQSIRRRHCSPPHWPQWPRS